MRSTELMLKCVVVSLAVVVATACTPSAPPEKKAATHDAHPEKGPHGGQLIALGDHAYHVEVVSDEGSGKVTLYMLDKGAKEAVSVASQDAVMNLMVKDEPQKFTFAVERAESDPEDKTSQFALTNSELIEALETEAIDTAELTVTIGGKQHRGKFELHGDHGHSHGHAGDDDHVDDILIWHKKEMALGDCLVDLGQHGAIIRAGHELEPAVAVNRGSESVADAEVFVTLLAEDGSVLVEEKKTVFEPETKEEPAHYAQAALAVPADAGQVVIRYRIVVGGDEVTEDLRMSTKSGE